MHSINILIVDDHPLVRFGLRQLIEGEPDLKVCCEANGMEAALQMVSQGVPDFIIVDLSLPDGNGLELVKRLRIRNKDVPILVSSMHDENLFAQRALAVGANGYISKQEASEKVIAAIREVLKGKIYLSDHMAERLMWNTSNYPQKENKSMVDYLSNRELEIFEYIGKGLSTSEIADKLHLSVKTIETHRASIKRKLGLETGSELTRSAVQWSLEGN